MARARSKTRSNTAPDGTEAETSFTCPECGKTFTRAAALGAHRRRSHGVAGASSSSRPATPSRSRRRATRTSSTPRAGSTTPNRNRARDGAGTTVDRDALLQAIFPNGVPPRESVIRAVNNWLDQAEQLAKMN
jgi:predicted RNA-binding Zn-ribbon protein involved in translation (DUF1610 family)